jgi:hypothetical protein
MIEDLMSKIPESFEDWKIELLHLGNIVQDVDASLPANEVERRFNRYVEMLEGLSGAEGFEYALAVMESIQAEQDYGAYQIAERAAFRFGEDTYCRVLIHELPRLIETLPDWAGDFLVSIANGQNTIYQSTIDKFNMLLSEAQPNVRSIIQAYITKEEQGGWFSHRVGVLGNNGVVRPR